MLERGTDREIEPQVGAPVLEAGADVTALVTTAASVGAESVIELAPIGLARFPGFGVTVTVLATGLAEAFQKDNSIQPGGFDVASGKFGPGVTAWVREVAEELVQRSQPALVPEPEPEPAGPVDRWRANRSVDINLAARDLAKQAFEADPRIVALEVQMDHSSGAAWVMVQMIGHTDLVNLEDTPGWPDGVPVQDLANIAYDLGDAAQTEAPIVFRR